MIKTMQVGVQLPAFNGYGSAMVYLENYRHIALGGKKVMHLGVRAGERGRKEATLVALYDDYYDRIARYIFAKFHHLHAI